MYVCICNGITDSDIRSAADAGARNLQDLSAMTGCATSCGTCADVAVALLRDRERSRILPLQILSAA
jgi:bacterioferritin-associated ferredoxin